ncbi:partial Cyclic di-GMP phosphodiesterase CdgJ, partial [uncultured bacterium]
RPMSHEILFGRQPILDARNELFGYELLFRDRDNLRHAVVTDQVAATATVITRAFCELGIVDALGPVRGFINVDKSFLHNDAIELLPADKVVIEVLEHGEITPDVIERCRYLKGRGYSLALDDFIHLPEAARPILEVVDIVKVDLAQLDDAALTALLGSIKSFGGQLLAEKVETLDEFEQWREIGFDLFQGYFLSKPTLLHSRRTQFNQGAVMQLMSRLQDPDVSLTTLEDIISTDVSLSVGLLRFVHSASVGAPPSLNSIRQAVMILGIKRTAAIVSLLSLSNVSGKAPALIANALQRAKMCELLAKSHRMGNLDQHFTTGLLSLLDCFLGMEMSEIVEQLPLSEGLQSARVGSDEESEIARVLCAATHYERADWEAIEGSEFDPADLSACYVESLQWSDEIAATMNGVS